MGRHDFRYWFRLLVDRACQAQGLTRQELADELGVHIHSVSTAGYRGQVGFTLLERIAKRARFSAAEITELELAWLALRSDRAQDDALRRSVSIIEALLEQIARIEGWLDRKGLVDEYKESLRADPLTRRVKRNMRRKP